ncbi:hypothetical protein H2509_01570 [Stappia sp. F7233]|uniref:Capsular polysaccharide export protein n=1 Tax=Stappia albiluteola TaxID=2758565 RepID=A0A839AAN7_9HYPH|nr:hypothetical protein [Stappia albiluteola]MBA5775809.1 hypothetical protein [Stappia albiluteola]
MSQRRALAVTLAPQPFKQAKEACLAGKRRLFLAAPGPLSGKVDKAFVDPASFLFIEIPREILMRTAVPAEALREAIAFMAAGEEGVPDRDQMTALIRSIDPGLRDADGDPHRTSAGPAFLLEAVGTNAIRFPSPYRRREVLPPADALQALEAAARQRRENVRPSFCVGVKAWNRTAIEAAFGSSDHPVTFCASVEDAIDRAAGRGGRVLCWAGASSRSAEAIAAARQVPFLRIEDGFLRSVGLGAGLVRGASFAVDDLGIYFDATRPSRMEERLNNASLGEGEIARGALLREMIVAGRVTKYNVGSRGHSLELPQEREILLVPGQVGDDAGIRKSISPLIDCERTENANLDLLRLVRARNPGAHILFKPHPDVQAGLRRGKVEDADLRGLADQVVTDIDILELLDVCDRVETISSLSGFEALMRSKPVTVYGMPFYAGWGLTDDIGLSAHRNARRTIDELVYIAFVDYIRCIDPVTLKPCSPEFLIGQLARLRGNRLHGLKARALRELSWLGRKLGL